MNPYDQHFQKNNKNFFLIKTLDVRQNVFLYLKKLII